MFDVQPNVDLIMTDIAINADPWGETAVVEVYYKEGTCVGFEGDPGSWTLLTSGSGVIQGMDEPTFIDLFPHLTVFEADKTYGLFVHLTSYGVNGQTLGYTNGFQPTPFSNPDLTLTTYFGMGFPPWTVWFFPRIWNGIFYYITKPAPYHAWLIPGGPWLKTGQDNWFYVWKCKPNEMTYLLYSVTGLNPTYIAPLNVWVILDRPYLASYGVSTFFGACLLKIYVPAGVPPGVRVWLQAVQNNLVSNMFWHDTM